MGLIFDVETKSNLIKKFTSEVNGLRTYNGSYNSVVTTMIIEKETITKNKLTGNKTIKIQYNIEQHVPYLSKPFYDCEFATNRYLDSVAKRDYAAARFYMLENKYNDHKGKLK